MRLLRVARPRRLSFPCYDVGKRSAEVAAPVLSTRAAGREALQRPQKGDCLSRPDFSCDFRKPEGADVAKIASLAT